MVENLPAFEGTTSENDGTGLSPIPTPRGLPFLGNIFTLDASQPIQSFLHLHETYGEIVSLDVRGTKRYLVGSQKLVHEICNGAGKGKTHKIVSGALKQVRNVVGDGLFTAHDDEPSWAIAHRILVPAFGPLAIKQMLPGMIDICDQLITKWERFGPDAKIDVPNDFTKLTLDTLALCTMNHRLNSFYAVEPPAFVAAMGRSLIQSGANVRRLNFPGSQIMYSKEDEQYKEDIDLQHKVVKEIIDERIRHPTEERDMLNSLLNGRDPVTGQGLTHENIINQLNTFLIAGHETTSGLLSFLFHYLMKNPEAYQSIRNEVDEVCGSEPVAFEHLSKLKYIDAALKETLRLQPTAPAFTVASDEDLVVQGRDGKYEIPAGAPCAMILHVLHRDVSVWGPDVEEFKPERMLNGGFEALPPDSWKPFGNGMRACIGRPFAWQESLLVVATIFQHFDIRPADDNYSLEIKSTLTVKPTGLYMHASPRKDRKVARRMAQGPDQTLSGQQHAQKSGDQAASTLEDAQLLIYYGSNSGTCEAFAHSLLASAQTRGCKAVIAGHLNKMAGGNVPTGKPVIIITASYEGKPTDDAGLFVSWLEKGAKDEDCKGVKYAVFGCGHTDWHSTYQLIPSLIANRIQEVGGQQLLERGVGNAAGSDLFGDFDDWMAKLWKILPEHISVKEAASSDPQLTAIVDRSYRIDKLRHSFLQSATVLSNRVITVGDGVEVKRHLEFELPEDVTYRSGDYLGILPVVPLSVVRRALIRFGLHADDLITLKSSVSSTLPLDQPLSAFDLISAFLELEHPASQKNIRLLLQLAKEPEDKATLEKLSEPDTFATEIAGKRISLLMLLEDYPKINMPFATFLGSIPAMRMRQYSISSSPLDKRNVASLTISILDAPHLSGRPGQRYAGTASTFLAGLVPGIRIRAAVRPSSEAFHPPADPSVPMIMLGAGSGIAPFRAFVQERSIQKASGRKIGRCILFYGCHSRDTDLLYDDEMAEWQKQGIVEVRHAFSRAPQESHGCKYVQDRVWLDRDDVADLYLKGARVYLCGSASLATGVKDRLVEIIMEKKTWTREQAVEKLTEIQGSRFATDVFGDSAPLVFTKERQPSDARSKL